ncbi:MAG: lipocalin-like domain-containing protein [Acidobacteria bacterium]|nr:lipocalin-like domain-containing protein [Acidobacteriota bacterium]
MNQPTLPKLVGRVLTLLALCVVTSSQVFPQAATKPTQPLSKQALLGTWHLVRFELVRSDGHVQEPFGAAVSGMLVYLADGGMIVIWGRENRPVPKNSSTPTSIELAKMLENFDSYWGTFDVYPDKSQVVHHVKGALKPNVVGADRVRSATLEKDMLTLVVPPSECWWDLANHCAPGEKIQARLTWRRK